MQKKLSNKVPLKMKSRSRRRIRVVSCHTVIDLCKRWSPCSNQRSLADRVWFVLHFIDSCFYRASCIAEDVEDLKWKVRNLLEMMKVWKKKTDERESAIWILEGWCFCRLGAHLSCESQHVVIPIWLLALCRCASIERCRGDGVCGGVEVELHNTDGINFS